MRKIPFILFTITFFYLISNFIAPLLLEHGSITHMDANANMIDHGEHWKEMMADGHVYEGIIYAFGDLNCHQISNRSYEINGNQMPVCSRDIGIFSGASIGFLILFWATPNFDFYETYFSVLPEKVDKRLFSKVKRKHFFFFVMFMSIVPTGFDGFYQLLTDYESTNFVRVVTGLLFGVPTSMAFGAFMMSGFHEEPFEKDYVKEALANKDRIVDEERSDDPMEAGEKASDQELEEPGKRDEIVIKENTVEGSEDESAGPDACQDENTGKEREKQEEG